MQTVAYAGRDGAHSAAACDRLFPQAAALDQCRRLLAAMPWATAIAAATTADAAHEVADGGGEDEAAIASERAAHAYGLTVIFFNDTATPEIYTRFVAV